MILYNDALMPHYFNNDQIKAVKPTIISVDESGGANGIRYTIDIFFEIDFWFSIPCNEENFKRNMHQIEAWNEYRYNPPDYFNTGFDNDVPSGDSFDQGVYSPLVPDSGSGDTTVSPGHEMDG